MRQPNSSVRTGDLAPPEKFQLNDAEVLLISKLAEHNEDAGPSTLMSFLLPALPAVVESYLMQYLQLYVKRWKRNDISSLQRCSQATTCAASL